MDRTKQRSPLGEVELCAMRLGLRYFYTKNGDLIIKKPAVVDRSGYGLEMFEPYESDQIERDELERIITILIR